MAFGAGGVVARTAVGRLSHAVLRQGYPRNGRVGGGERGYPLKAASQRRKELVARRLADRGYLIDYVDGIQFGDHHVLPALGVDDDGNKRIRGVWEGTSENAVVALGRSGTLSSAAWIPASRACPSSTARRRCEAVGQLFGSSCRVQRCRNQKVCNPIGHMPRELNDQARSVQRAT